MTLNKLFPYRLQEKDTGEEPWMGAHGGILVLLGKILAKESRKHLKNLFCWPETQGGGSKA